LRFLVKSKQLPASRRTACLLRSALLHYAINQTGAFIDSEAITRYLFRNRYVIRNGEAATPMMPRVDFIRYGRIKTKA